MIKPLLASLSAIVLCACASPDRTMTDDVRSGPAPTHACDAAEFRQFDFWVGQWDIAPREGGPRTGRNTITAEHDGCVIVERYVAENGGGAMSVSGYDAKRGVWRQTWSSNSGAIAYLEGGPRTDGTMELTDRDLPSTRANGLWNRVTWAAEPDGGVRQSWQISRDQGATWITIFDDRYVRS